MPEAPDEKRMKLRYAGACRICGAELPKGVDAIYERPSKTVRCLDCSPAMAVSTPDAPSYDASPVESIDVGTPGASARREFDRRQSKREERIRAKHPKLGGLILALSDDPQSTTAWDTGAVGEERLGNRLNELASETMRVLHDRRIPGTKANIDHLAVTASGIFVIDAKKYKGRPHLKIEGGLLRPRTEKLLVGARDCTKLVDGVRRQVDLVRSIVGADVTVTGVLCFVEADWPLIGGAFSIRDVEVLWPRKLYPRLASDGPYGAQVAVLHQMLASALPPA